MKCFNYYADTVLFIYVNLFSTVYCVSNWPSKSDLQTRLLEDDELDGQSTFFVYHSLEPMSAKPIYTPRGTIVAYMSRNEAVYTQDKPISNEEIDKLKTLASTDAIYRIKLLSKPDDVDSSIFSFTKACSIYESMLTDSITLTLDQTGLPIGIAISALPPYCTGTSVADSKLFTFNTSVNMVTLVNAPVPDTQTYIQRLEQEKAEKARGEQGDNRSFFAKYWMYIVPVVIFLFISGASGPEGQGGGR